MLSSLPRAAILLLAAAFVLGACSNDPNPAPLRQTRQDGSPWLVRYSGLSEDPRSFDPQYMYDQVSRRVLELVYDTLLEYHPFKTEPYEVRPGLLEEMPKKEVSAEGKVSYLCRLKTTSRFHDDPCFPGGKGRPVRAEDVHLAFQRMLDPKVESPFLSVFSEFIVGMQELARRVKDNHEVFDYSWRIPGIEVVDERTFRLHLTKPYPLIVYWLAMHATTPVAREAVNHYDGKEHGGVVRGDFHKFAAVGTGPYRVHEYTPRQRVRLVRVDGYTTTTFPTDGFPSDKAEWLEPLAGKPLPFLDEINMPILRETIPIFILTRQGFLDGMAVNKDAFASMVAGGELAPKYRERGMTLELDVDPATFWINFNLEDPVVGKNVKLRQALSCAYDTPTYSKIFLNGVAPVASQLLPPGMVGYDPQWVNPWAFDLEKAKRLLAEAGYPNGRDAKTGQQLVLRLNHPASGSEDRQRAEFEQRCFQKLGIKVEVEELTFARLLDKLHRGDYQISSGSGWGADYPDAENFFALFHSRNFPPNGSNHSRYSRAEFDEMYDRMAVMDHGPERLAIIRKMNAMLAEDCPIVLNFVKAYYTAIQPWARRPHSNAMLEGGLKYVTVDPVLREQKRKEWNRKPLWPLLVLGGLFGGGAVYAIRWSREANA
jgi:ABC-type transport system substrate-binding protein